MLAADDVGAEIQGLAIVLDEGVALQEDTERTRLDEVDVASASRRGLQLVADHNLTALKRADNTANRNASGDLGGGDPRTSSGDST
ncbi:MAG: hypothetical protein IKX93_00265, partial [Bacteroidaceae bacterium]|nr:hypothetical protein [Bacteroidaceae bacterium]